MSAGVVTPIPDALDGARADRAVAQLLDVGVSAARRLMLARRVRMNGRLVKKGELVHAGDIVVLEGSGAWLVPSLDGASALVPLYVDEHVIIVDKPAGMPCHPLVPGEGGTVVDALAMSFPEIAAASLDPREAGLVHRLDTGTSGCLAIARDRARWLALREAFASGVVVKRYLALVHGRVEQPIVIDTHLVHDARDRRRMRLASAGEEGAQHCQTRARTVAVGAGHALVEVEAHGGRRHQVRAHLAASGHPLVGDVLYGAQGGGDPAGADVAWHLLHASALGLPGLPVLTAPVPPAFRDACARRGLDPARWLC